MLLSGPFYFAWPGQKCLSNQKLLVKSKSVENELFRGQSYKTSWHKLNQFNVIHGKIQIFESIFDVIVQTISFGHRPNH